nr:large ribosomal subunit protein mL49-like [Nerophis lumbriciformis]
MANSLTGSYLSTSAALTTLSQSNMAVCYGFRALLLRGALRGAFGFHQRLPGPPVAIVGRRSVCVRAPDAVIEESTDEYSFVERLIPPTRVPSPPQHAGPTPSGWTPPAESPPALPYMIRRSRMHNIPVYTDLTHGNRKMTLVRKVEGDIWALEKDVKEYLKHVTGKELATQVNEVTMTLKVKGHFDKELKEMLSTKGF